MAHELSFRNGVAEMFSVRETPWHREGHLLEEAPTYDEALQLAGLDFEVVKAPTFTKCLTPEGDEYFKQNATAFTTRRADTGAELGNVGAGYTPLQTPLAFRSIVPLLDKGVVKLETGGSLRGGADAWLLARFDLERFGPVVREIFADEVVPYVLLTNNHTGRRNATVAETPIRVVCANTLGMAEHAMNAGASKHIGVRHTAEAETRMVEAAEQLFAGVIERYEVIATQYKLLKQTIIDRDAFERLVLDAAVPDPRKAPSFNPDAKLAEMVVERADRKRAAIEKLWHSGAGHTGDNSAWEAYNALVEAVDHDNELFPIRGGTYRTAALLDGRLREIKTRVLTNLVHASKASDFDSLHV